MIITGLYINNFCGFHNAFLDLTLKRKPKFNTVPYEFLEGNEKFMFRRVCVLSGANATGKTSVGRLLNIMQVAVQKAETFSVELLADLIGEKTEDAQIGLEFVVEPSENPQMCRFDVEFVNGKVEYCFTTLPIAAVSATTMRKRLEQIRTSGRYGRTGRTLRTSNYQWVQDEILSTFQSFSGWYYLLARSNESFKDKWSPNSAKHLDTDILKAVLKTFDASVAEVLKTYDENGGFTGFSVIFVNGDRVTVDDKGRLTNEDRLSRGTLEAVHISTLLSRIVSDASYGESLCNTYFVDESMAFAHTELEQAVLNLMIEKLGRNCQLFYTTHNYDILEMNLPVHSYVFLRNTENGVEFVQPCEQFRKNDRKLLNYVKNNVFKTLPDSSALDELLWESA